jgi:hypothetical protein
MESNKLAFNAAYFRAMVRTKELLLAYEAAAADAAKSSRTGMFEAVYEAAEAYDDAFEQLDACLRARDEADKNQKP